MLDLKWVRENPNLVAEGAAKKNVEVDVDYLLSLDSRRRELITRTEEFKKQRNDLSGQVGKLLKAGEDAEPVKEQVRRLGDEISATDGQANAADTEIRDLLLSIPNIPHESVPVGKDESSNRVVREWGSKPEFSFKPRGHWEIGEQLGIFDFNQGAKISGSGFIVYKGKGARLQRALIDLMLDMHTDRHGYTEIRPPYLVNRDSMTGTGQLPKFEDDAYRIDSEDLFLIPTAEVPVTNLRRDEIIPVEELPIKMAAYTPCFRKEAGSYGRESRGVTRIHQFDKVELVKLVKPETSFDELESLLAEAEAVLQELNLHYRVLEICTGDLGFSNCKQYDLEVWAPGMDMYLEVSSCSNFTDYQARRAGIKFRREAKAKPEFVHTLNGSALALPRTLIAILEQYQKEDGSVEIPARLKQILGDQIAT
jgi:seryl-tRNA synthetase